MSKSVNEVSEKEFKKIKEAILELFSKHPNKTYNHKQVARHVKQISPFVQTLVEEKEFSPSQFKTVIIASMNDLFKNDELVETEIGKYRKIFAESYVTGKIDIASSGAAYLMNEDHEDDIYISPRNVNNALNGDTVTILLHAQKSGRRLSGEVTEIVERAKTEFVGLMQVSPKFAFLVPDSIKMDVDIFIPLEKLNGAKHGQKAVAKITDWSEETHNPVGEVTTVLGEPGDNETEMHAILVEYGFPLDFPEAVYMETEKIAHKIPSTEIKKRKDFRKICTFTIDPEDAKDFDDAISFEKLSNGNYSVGIHIADVTHYVRENTALNREAVQRATSVYLVDRVIPMLPEKISNEVCSLRPNEDKLCFSAVFELNENTDVINEWFGRTIIHSTQRFSYQQAQDVIDKKSDTLTGELAVLNNMAQKMRKERFNSGAINFESVEVKFRLDETGYPTGVYVKTHKEANQLIEEFMLLANRKVAEFVGKKYANDAKEKKKAFVYRIHDVPKPEKLESFSAFANKFGYRILTSDDSKISLATGLEKNKKYDAMDSYQERAYGLILGDAKKAFEMSEEKDEIRERYGRNRFGQSCLLARRLVERGVPFVSVNSGGWDTHRDNFGAMKRLLPPLDQGFSALLEDLALRGLLDTTIVTWFGEFGRTPKIAGGAPWDGGRHHYGPAQSVVVAGGGFQGGMVVGETDDKGEHPKERTLYPWDLTASMYTLLGIDPLGTLPHPLGCVAYVTPVASGDLESGGLLTEIM